MDPAQALAERLSDPRTAAALGTLLDHAELLAILVKGLDELVARSDTITESLTGGITELRAAGAQTTARAASLITTGQQLAAVLPQLTTLVPPLVEKLPVLEELLSSDIADPRVIHLAGTVSRAAVAGATQAEAAPVKVTGLRGLLRALKDPDVGRALGLVISVARALGAELDKQPGQQPGRR